MFRSITWCLLFCCGATALAQTTIPSSQPVGEIITLGEPSKPSSLPAATEGNTHWNHQRRMLKLPDGTLQSLGLESMDGVEEPTIRWIAAEKRGVKDDFVSITDEGGGTLRMLLRYTKETWDGDQGKATTSDRQRAEVKGLGPHQKPGDTFEYGTTFRVDPDFRGTNRFCHIFQLKATDGDNGAPLVTLSMLDGVGHAALRSWEMPDGTRVDVPFDFKPGEWTSVKIRIKTTPATGHDGELKLSVNGGEFHGQTDIALFRPGATDYRPKWGLYRGIADTLHDDWIEHKDITAKKIE